MSENQKSFNVSTSSNQSIESNFISSHVTGSPRKSLFLEKVKLSNAACQNGNFNLAVNLYTEAISIEPNNHILYSNRSAVYIKLSQFSKALQDARSAEILKPDWPKGYYREGVALQCLGQHEEALAAFSNGLVLDPKSSQLLTALIDTATKSHLSENLESTILQLETMQLHQNAFVIIAVIGQELLAGGKFSPAITILESALKIGTSLHKLRGSVFSALSSAYWAVNCLDKAIHYMQQDLAVAKLHEDVYGECRAYGNLGSAYFSKGNFKEALTSHRYQLVLALKYRDMQAAAIALTSLGHVYTAIGDYPNALASHKQCVQIVKQNNAKILEAREIGNVGAVYLAMGDFDNALDCHMEHLTIATQLDNKVEEARAYSNLGSCHHFKRDYDQAIAFHNQVLKISQELSDKNIEARAYAGLGHSARCMGDYTQAQKWHEKQLDMALSSKDKTAEGRACSNLGIVYQLRGNYDAALKLHQSHLNSAKLQHDRAGMGRAYGNIGNAFNAMGRYEEAINYHKKELAISKEVNDKVSEGSTHGNLAVTYQALNLHEMSLLHYHSHLNIAKELKDSHSEACALLNLANCHSSKSEFAQAVTYYEQYLMLSQELHDTEGEAKACHFLGYAHFCLQNFKEAIRYYDQDLTLSKDRQDYNSISRAYCNLGLAHSALGNFETALECQKYFLAFGHLLKDHHAAFRALGNIGEIFIKQENYEESLKVYHKQLRLAKQTRDAILEASAYASLGLTQRLLKCYDKALSFHTQELTVCQEINDASRECQAHGNLGSVHMALGCYTNAFKCYQEQLEKSKELNDLALQAKSLGNLGIAQLNTKRYNEAVKYFEHQLATLYRVNDSSCVADQTKSLNNLGDCYSSLGDYKRAVVYYEKCLKDLRSSKEREKCYRSLAHAFKCLGDLQQALVCYEKRLVIASDLNCLTLKANSYGDLGNTHALLGNFDQAFSCINHQIEIHRQLQDRIGEADSLMNLGSIYKQNKNFKTALNYYVKGLEIAEDSDNVEVKCNALSNICLTYESLGDMQNALMYGEQQLKLLPQINDKSSRITSCFSLGRIYYSLKKSELAISYLREGLNAAQEYKNKDEEIKLRHHLGLALWRDNQLQNAKQQFQEAVELIDNMRKNEKYLKNYNQTSANLFDLQTASYHALQCVLVELKRPNDALVVAERLRVRGFLDLLVEKENLSSKKVKRMKDLMPTTIEEIVNIVDCNGSAVLYFSIVDAFLFSWLILPNEGVVKFHQVNLSEIDVLKSKILIEKSNICAQSSLELYIESVRNALVEANEEIDLDGENTLSCDLGSSEQLNDANSDTDKTGFLKMINRNNIFNSSNYSMSSVLSLSSLKSRSIRSSRVLKNESTRGKHIAWQGPPCLESVYDLLISPFDSFLLSKISVKDLVLVLQGSLYLLPFSVLKNRKNNKCLGDTYSSLIVPSLTFLKMSQKLRQSKHSISTVENATLVVGNPKLPQNIIDHWGWESIPHAEQTAQLVSNIFDTTPLLSSNASKESVLRLISQAECIHFSTHVSWKLSAIVFSSTDDFRTTPPSSISKETSGNYTSSGGDEPTSKLSEFLLTAREIVNVKLKAKLVVLSSWYTPNDDVNATSDGLVALSEAFLAAGVHCVLLSLWPVPHTAVQIFFKTFYSSALQGTKMAEALSEAQQAVRSTKLFSHPMNWCGFLLIGSDAKISNRAVVMGKALCDIIRMPDKCRDALRVCLHLIEKSLQRMYKSRNQNGMYTTQKSIEKKVGSVTGWKELLMTVGFRFEAASDNIPSSVFFPQSDPGDRLVHCSATLQALLGLNVQTLKTVSEVLERGNNIDSIISIIENAAENLTANEMNVSDVKVNLPVKVWRSNGCHELFASLGFDLIEVGKDEVILRSGKEANKRNIQNVLQCLRALFRNPKSGSTLSSSPSS